jgi:EAL domain-containing protein (putative c-di-GMP-specific phosphodiesterase class I)
LRSFPFSKIKLDRSFVAELGQKEDCLAIIRAVAQLGINLGMRTLAEGIETKRQLDLIRQEGIGQAQGYLFGRAVPARDVFSVITRFAQLAA